MDIKKATLHKPTKKEAGGLDIPPVFMVDLKNGETVSVPAFDPRNKDYWEVRAWYFEQKTKPFEFDFLDIPEAQPEPETDEDGSGITLSAEQTKDAKLPAVNLTREQRREIAEKQQK